MERETGVEPATSSLGSWHSTTELLPRFGVLFYLTAFKFTVHQWQSQHSTLGLRKELRPLIANRPHAFERFVSLTTGGSGRVDRQ